MSAMSVPCQAVDCCLPNYYDYASNRFGNIQASATATCPPGTTGEPVSVIIPANTYFRETQEEANEAALNAALEQAEAELDCTPVT